MNDDFRFQPDLADTAEVDFGVTRDGLSQLRRYWAAPDPRAVVLLVHGIAEHCGRYEHVARQFVASGISVVGYDQRGFGESGGRRAYIDRFQQFHDDVEDHLERLRDTGLPSVVLGHSMGGLIAAGYGVTSRPQPDLMVLSAPALGGAAPDWATKPLSAIGRVMGRTKVPLPFRSEDLATDQRVGEDYDADPLVSTPTSLRLIGEMARSIQWFDDRLHTWHLPAVVVHGLEDTMVPPEASEAIGARPEVTRLTYPGLRHEVFNEPTGPAVVADVLGWLDARLA